MGAVLQKLLKFGSGERGSMSIEYVVMVPLFIALISGAVDLSRVFVDQSNFYSAARDTARIVARHGMDEDAAEDYAAVRVAQITSAATVTDVTIDTTSVTVTISAPVTALAKFQFLSFLNSVTLSASATQALEPS